MWGNLYGLLDAVAPAANDLAPGADGAAPGNLIGTVIMMVGMVAVFYFLLIRPQKKKDKAVKNMLSALKVSDRICTIGGIYGTVTAIKDDTVTIVVGSDKTKMVIARWGIRSVEDAPLENDAEALV